MVFYDNQKKIFAFSLPPPTPPVDERFDELSGKNFLGHHKKYRAKECCKKKILSSNWGMKKNSCTEKLPNPPSNI
jgi:hypothetical protein